MGARRRRGTGTIQYDKSRGDYAARTADRARSGRFATRKDAEKALDAWNAQIARGVDLLGSRQSLQQFASVWLADVAARRVKVRTQEFYARHLSYAIGQLGGVPIGDLTPQHIDRALGALGDAGLAPRGVAHVRSVLHNALKTAEKWRLLESNPVRLSDAPRVPEAPDRTLAPAQVDALLAAIQGHRLEALWAMLIYLGPRPGELLALRWADVDLDAAAFVIRDSKTESGRRAMPLTADTVALLRAHWTSQLEERAVLGIAWKEHSLVFPSEVGTPISSRNLSRAFKAVCARAGLPRDTQVYDLRRTAISWWIETGASPRAAQALAGHSDPGVTLGIYAKSKIDPQRAVVEEAERRRKSGG